MTKAVFVCSHGAAKSVIAAEYFQRMSAQAGEDVCAVAYGVDPDTEIPAPVVERLCAEGFDVAGRLPAPVDPSSLADADVIVLIGCEVTDVPTNATVVRWEGVPAVSDGYEQARTEIVQRLTRLLDQAT